MILIKTLKSEFNYWEIAKGLIDQCIYLMLKFSQSGHPEAYRPKLHALGGVFSGRFIFVAGNCNPVVYNILIVFSNALILVYNIKKEIQNY